MKNLTPIVTGIAVISAIACATMWSELRTERALTADLRTQLAEARTLPRTSAPMAQGTQPQPTTVIAAAAAKNPDDKPEPAKPAAIANPNANIQDYRAREKEMMKDPEYRKARLAQQRLQVERNYPGLVEELGLSQKDADRFFDLVAEYQFNMSNMITELAGGGNPDQAARAEINQKQQAMARQQEEQIAALLGPGQNARYQEYQQTQGARVQVSQWGQQLAQAGQPLNATQQRALTTAMASEQKRLQQEVAPMVRNINQADPQARMQMQEDFMKREEDSRRRVLDAAAQSLTSQQVASLKEQFEIELAMNKAQQRMERRRVEMQATGQAGAPAPASAP